MLGAIIGDIVGSRYEFDNRKTKEFELFEKQCQFTDDSVMTIAIAKALLDCNENYEDLSIIAIENMVCIGRKYPYCGYGYLFYDWICSENHVPYNSFGNGAAMRVSCCGFVGNSIDEVKELSKKVTEISHNHPEGIKGAEATAVSIYLARTGKTKEEIKQYICDNYYNIDFTLDEIRKEYEFNETCQGSVPQALESFFESTSYEDTIRNAISLGGDSDTIGAIAGGIAEAYYGIPKKLRDKALTYLDDDLKNIVFEFENKYEPKII